MESRTLYCGILIENFVFRGDKKESLATEEVKLEESPVTMKANGSCMD